MELDVQTEEEPEELDDAQPDVMMEDRHVDTEPMKEPELLSDDDKSDEEEDLKELPDEEMSFRRGYVDEHLLEEDKVEEEEEFLIKRNYVLDEQPIIEMEPEMREAVANPVVVPGGALIDEEQMSESYLRDEEAQMKMFVREEDDSLQLNVRQQDLMRENTKRQGVFYKTAFTVNHFHCEVIRSKGRLRTKTTGLLLKS